jgi:hypothetical protein
MKTESDVKKSLTTSDSERVGVDDRRLVRFRYEGKTWTAEKNLHSICNVIYRNTESDRDGMSWSAPTEEMAELQWKILHCNYVPNRKELMAMSSVISSFRELLNRDAKRQRAIATSMQKVLEANV